MHGIFAHSTSWVQFLCKYSAALGDTGGVHISAEFSSLAIGMLYTKKKKGEGDNRKFSSTRKENSSLQNCSSFVSPATTTNELLNTRSRMKCKLWDAEAPVVHQQWALLNQLQHSHHGVPVRTRGDHHHCWLSYQHAVKIYTFTFVVSVWCIISVKGFLFAFFLKTNLFLDTLR